jgi:hypothetical protein
MMQRIVQAGNGKEIITAKQFQDHNGAIALAIAGIGPPAA